MFRKFTKTANRASIFCLAILANLEAAAATALPPNAQELTPDNFSAKLTSLGATCSPLSKATKGERSTEGLGDRGTIAKCLNVSLGTAKADVLLRFLDSECKFVIYSLRFEDDVKAHENAKDLLEAMENLYGKKAPRLRKKFFQVLASSKTSDRSMSWSLETRHKGYFTGNASLDLYRLKSKGGKLQTTAELSWSEIAK